MLCLWNRCICNSTETCSEDPTPVWRQNKLRWCHCTRSVWQIWCHLRLSWLREYKPLIRWQCQTVKKRLVHQMTIWWTTLTVHKRVNVLRLSVIASLVTRSVPRLHKILVWQPVNYGASCRWLCRSTASAKSGHSNKLSGLRHRCSPKEQHPKNKKSVPGSRNMENLDRLKSRSQILSLWLRNNS